MSKIFSTIKQNYKKAVLFFGLFLAVFIALFYIVNLNLDPSHGTTAETSSIPKIDGKLGEKIKSDNIGFSDFQEWSKVYRLQMNDNVYDADPDKDGLPNYLEYVYLTNPNVSDTDGDGYSDQQEVANGYDPDAKGNPKVAVQVLIDKLGIQAPMVWSASEDEKSMLKDLESGISHYPGTGVPGQNGNMIISGHSSNYIWAKGDFNHIFKDLNNLEKGDTVTVKTIQENGRVILYRYKITGKYVDAPDDPRIFEDSEKPMLTLSTCWPLGTNLKRLVMKAEIVN